MRNGRTVIRLKKKEKRNHQHCFCAFCYTVKNWALQYVKVWENNNLNISKTRPDMEANAFNYSMWAEAGGISVSSRLTWSTQSQPKLHSETLS